MQEKTSLVKVKLGGQTYHVHISEQEKQARKEAHDRANLLHKETIRRKRNHEQKKLSHEQKEEQHRQKVLAARRAQLMLQTQRYLRATSRRPAPPQHPRNKITSPRPYSALQYPSGTFSARDENGEIESVLKKINKRVDRESKLVDQDSKYGPLEPIRTHSARPHHREILQNRPSTAAIISKISSRDIKNVTDRNSKNMRLATNKFGQDLFDMVQGDMKQAGDMKPLKNRKQWKTDESDSKQEEIENVKQLDSETQIVENRRDSQSSGAGDSHEKNTRENDAFRKETTVVFQKNLQTIEPIPQPPIVVARIQELQKDIKLNTKDRHIPSPLENIPDNPTFLPKPPSKRPHSVSHSRTQNRTENIQQNSSIQNSPPKYESVFQLSQPASDSTKVNESVASASSSESNISSIRDIVDSDESNSSETVMEKKFLNPGPPGILRRSKSAFIRNGVFDSIDLAKNRTKSAGVRRKSVRWKQVEYNDGTVKPFPSDIDDFRKRGVTNGTPTIKVQTNISNKPSILQNYKRPTTQKIIQDASITGYAQQHIARKQFNKQQSNKSKSNQIIQKTVNTSKIRPKSASNYDHQLESRRTPTDNEITQLWQTVKHVIDKNDDKNHNMIQQSHIRQLPQSYYLPRPPTANNSAFVYSPGFRGGGSVKLNRPKLQNPSSLSMEEQRLVQSLDRLNNRLNEIETNVRK